MSSWLNEILGAEADSLLKYECKRIPRQSLHLPGPDHVDRILGRGCNAVINKRAGGMGLISGRKAFQRPMAEGVKLLHQIQDVYRDRQITVA
jgi:hypothetical protein